MADCEPSGFLRSRKGLLRETIQSLRERYDYVSCLASDSSGINFNALGGTQNAEDSPWSERGFVFRAQRGGRIAECALNELPETGLADRVSFSLDSLLDSKGSGVLYPELKDPATGDFGGEIRLAYLCRGTERIPVTGGSVTGTMAENRGRIRLSRERRVPAVRAAKAE